jgi:cobalamin biosynthesis Mg chelatase CobN
VLALLALSCFPVFAQAEIQYEDEVPDINTPSQKKDPGNQSNPKAGSSNSEEAGGTVAGGSGGSGTGGSGSGVGSSGSGDNPSTGKDGNTGQASSGKGSTAPGTIGGAEAVATESAAADDGGSSPLVPILIAIAALAAISIGFVLYRQRRGPGDDPAGDGSTVSSPEPN